MSEQPLNSLSASNNALAQWLNQHRELLREKYRCQYIAYNTQGIMANGTELSAVLHAAQQTGQPFVIYFVPYRQASMVLLPIRLRSVSRHDWVPNYPVVISHGDIHLTTNMLVDSGADFSVMSLKIGQDFGYALADGEQLLLASGIGGDVGYVLRSVAMMLDGHHFRAPVAWLQTKNDSEELILGREVVFDKFNIEFCQAEEKIIFTWRSV